MVVTLSKKEILTLSQLLSENNRSIVEMRESEPLAKYIQLTKTPPRLTESMIFHLVKDRKILKHLK